MNTLKSALLTRDSPSDVSSDNIINMSLLKCTILIRKYNLIIFIMIVKNS